MSKTTNRSIRAIFGLAFGVVLSSCGEKDLLEPRPSWGHHDSDDFLVVYVTADIPPTNQAAVSRAASLSDAISMVRAGGTIFVGDGEWETGRVVIDKPLTLTAAPQADPLLVNHLPDSDGLTIDGVTEGTVTLRGLRFLNAAGLNAVRARGTYDRVVVRNSYVEVTAPHAGPGTAHGINATTSTIPDGQIMVEGTTFEGGRFCAIAQGTTAHVRDNTFTDCAFASVQYTLESRGTIENNVIEGCGRNACITAFDPDGVVIEGNRISHPSGTARHGIVARGFGPGPYSAVIADNELIGTGVEPDDLDPFSEDGPNAPWGRSIDASALRSGIQARGAVTATVRENHVSGAHWGILFTRGASGAIAANQVSNCGGVCITVVQPATGTAVERNLVSGDVGFRRALLAINAITQEPAAPITVWSNTLAGSYNGGDPFDALSYAFRVGIQAMSWDPLDPSPPQVVTGAQVHVFGNSVMNAGSALQSVLGGWMNAHDNVVQGAGLGVGAFDALSVMSANRNDILDAALDVVGGAAVITAGALDATCNWWGSPSGPANAGAPAGVYTPWAAEPIANQPLVECG